MQSLEGDSLDLETILPIIDLNVGCLPDDDGALKRLHIAWVENLLDKVDNFFVPWSKVNTDERKNSFLRLLNLSIRQKHNGLIEKALHFFSIELITDWCENETRQHKNWTNQTQRMQMLWWTSLYRVPIIQAFHVVIESRVEKECRGEYDKPFIAELTKWLEWKVMPCAAEILGLFSDPDPTQTTIVKENLHRALKVAISKVRANELFEMVADFPDSLVAIKELKEASVATSMQPHVGKVFRAAVKRRLLLPGASTSQIIDMYVAMIRALRVLDSSDLVLNYVAAPVRTYLMGRRDTVRCVVASLTEGKDSDLHGELRRGGSLEYGMDEDDEDAGPGEGWMPRKRDPDLAEAGARGLDVLALLVSIYGSTDVFITEYRSLLADKLLSNIQYNTDSEVATLELLKIRFGEEQLHSCEVMLRDIEESKRTNNAVALSIQTKGVPNPTPAAAAAAPAPAPAMATPPRSSSSSLSSSSSSAAGNAPEFVVDMAIISDNYWPSLGGGDGDDETSLAHHPRAHSQIEAYGDTYAALKKPRKLQVQRQMGLVQLELDFGDGATRKFQVPPVQATLVLHLGDMGSASAGALATATGLEVEEVERKMLYWVTKKVVRVRPSEGVDSFGRSGPDGGGGGSGVMYEVDEAQAENARADERAELEGQGLGADADEGPGYHDNLQRQTEAQEKSSMDKLVTVILGVISSQGRMPLERLHTMLKLIAGASGSTGGGSGDIKFDMGMVQLQRVLQTLVDTDRLEFAEGVYMAAKPNRS